MEKLLLGFALETRDRGVPVKVVRCSFPAWQEMLPICCAVLVIASAIFYMYIAS